MTDGKLIEICAFFFLIFNQTAQKSVIFEAVGFLSRKGLFLGLLSLSPSSRILNILRVLQTESSCR